ncbi:outer membrane protein [Rubellimicrobium aerolatum]|uniref:Outer membrane protein n=1 Tax=Rubellimicrobium aerolatum TaxID=490979 RepID=A0ABW0SI95_9RHOB|nr:porin family protein [Rubellimicrobium aerolatum]MBP1807703.1 opacity protein-like surface antigen [Rubellimicrobium aerolatum]
MTKLLPLGVAVFVAGAVPAIAGGFAPAVTETPVAAPAPVVAVAPTPSPSSNWSGAFLGGQLAYGQLGLETGDDEQDFDGAIGGLHAGYQRDFGRVVAGAELAYDWANLSAEDESAPALAGGAELDAVARAGVKVGYDAGRVLPYLAGGYANASFSGDVAGSDDDQVDGYYVGAGVDYALTDRVSVGAQVLRHEFDIDAGDLDTGLTTVGVTASYRF